MNYIPRGYASQPSAPVMPTLQPQPLGQPMAQPKFQPPPVMPARPQAMQPQQAFGQHLQRPSIMQIMGMVHPAIR